MVVACSWLEPSRAIRPSRSHRESAIAGTLPLQRTVGSARRWVAAALVPIECSERLGEPVAVGAAPFGEMPSPAAMVQGIKELMPDADRHVPDQHVVSRVILKQFAEPYGTKREVLLGAVDRQHPTRKMTTGGPHRYGKVRDYVRFASGAAEELWHRTETRLHEPLEAIKRDGQLSDPAHGALIRDAIALHVVRSIPTRAYHQDSWVKHREAARQRLRAQPRLLQEIHVQQFGWWTSDPERLERAIDWFYGPLDAVVASDALFRYSLAERLERLRTGFEAFDLKILISRSREFLIGDAPVLMLCDGRGGLGTFDGVGVANADEIVLPLTPHHVAVLGQDGDAAEATDEEVERYNALEVMIAYKDVCFRPTSGLDAFVRNVLAAPASP